jgi:hypothetical protein
MQTPMDDAEIFIEVSRTTQRSRLILVDAPMQRVAVTLKITF